MGDANSIINEVMDRVRSQSSGDRMNHTINQLNSHRSSLTRDKIISDNEIKQYGTNFRTVESDKGSKKKLEVYYDTKHDGDEDDDDDTQIRDRK